MDTIMIRILSVLSIFVGLVLNITPLFAQTAWESDETDFFVQSSTNEALEVVNEIICFMNATAPDKMVNQGPYVANIYQDECESEDISGDEDAAKPVSAQAQQNASNSSSSGEAEERAIVSAVVDVKRVDEDSPMIVKAWVLMNMADEDPSLAHIRPPQPPALIYVRGEVKAPPSETSKFGEFNMQMTYTMSEDYRMVYDDVFLAMSDDDKFAHTISAGQINGGAYLSANGQQVVFVEEGMNAPPQQVTALFSGDEISGVYTIRRGVFEESTEKNLELKVNRSFAVNNATKVYCHTLLSAIAFDFINRDDQGDPIQAVYNPRDGDGLQASEVCYSLNAADAIKNVWRYGIYNEDGSKANLGVSGFSMITEITGDFDLNETQESRELWGWAEYWGVHFDNRFKDYVDENTVWTRRTDNDFKNPDSNPPQYKIVAANQRVEKVTRSYNSLSDLDALTLSVYIDTLNDDWRTQYNTLGFSGEKRTEYQGTYDAATETWTFDKEVQWADGYTETVLTGEDIISFTNTDWLNTMVNNRCSPDSCIETQSLWAWSPDTGENYEIQKRTLENPTDSSSINAISVESRQTIPPSDYPASLVCITQCPTAATMTAMADAVIALDGETTNKFIVSPFHPDNWIVEIPGIVEAKVKTYTFDGFDLKDSTNTVMALPTNLTAETVGEAQFYWPWNGGNSSSHPIKHGVGTGKFVLPDDLSKLDCPRVDPNDPTSDYVVDNPDFGQEITRYCEDAYFIPSKGITTWYYIDFGINSRDRQRYIQDIADSSYVNFSKPMKVYYDVPDDSSKFGDDAGKKLLLNFAGQGDLRGIPGEVINTITGESLGDRYHGEWNENLRYVQRFIIEPYNNVDPTITDAIDSSITYKVKALEGEEFLKTLPGAIGTLSYALSEASLPAYALIKCVSATCDANDDNIGEIPTEGLLNNGDPSVVHGEVVVTLD